MRQGFTLVELSIVLVIIGLVTGVILTGRSLISAAAVRAQISQVERYKTAVNTFRAKYGFLPGDIPEPHATQYGFTARGADCDGSACPGEGNGDWLLQGLSQDCRQFTGGILSPLGWCGHAQIGETTVFWADLSKAGLIEGGFTAARSNSGPASDVTGSDLDLYYPKAKIANAQVYIWSDGGCDPDWYATHGNCVYAAGKTNYFGISRVSALAAATDANKLLSSVAVTVADAFAADSKIDDGLPQTGRVLSIYLNNDPIWSDGWGMLYSPPNTGATLGSSTSCFDNNNQSGGTQRYSMAQNGGAGLNCGLSFRFE